MTLSTSIQKIFSELGLNFSNCNDVDAIAVHSPIDGSFVGRVQCLQDNQVNTVIARAHLRSQSWRNEPGPRRGTVVRSFGDLVRKHKASLAQLITLETGKIVQESLGEVQEVVDICEFALGLSRQLYGLTIASERPDHKLLETWHLK